MKKMLKNLFSMTMLVALFATSINLVVPTTSEAGVFTSAKKQKRQARRADKKAIKARKQAHKAAEAYLKAADKKKEKALKKLTKAADKAGWPAISAADATARAQAVVDHYAKCSGKACYEDATIPMPETQPAKPEPTNSEPRMR
jgi:hypothetical protein